MTKKRLLNGLQPSGELTIANYLGSTKQFVKLVKDYESFLFVPDMHAITVPQDPKILKERIMRCVNINLACGLDPNDCTLFIQSEVPAHSQLSWILECYTGMGELNRMTQFKDKSVKQKTVGCGLFTYPVLMASDILLYDTNLVTVGEDQKQHIELARDLAQRFNSIYGDVFVVPEGFTPKTGARIKGLQNPEKKMSKSAKDKMDSIFLLDSEKDVINKINRAVTDSESKVYYDEKNKPGISNLIALYSALTDMPLENANEKFAGMERYGDFKKQVTEAVLDFLVPFQKRYQDLVASGIANEILDKGRKKANVIASEKYEQVRKIIGLGR